jgi:small-conductance mechanosensitive channel
MTRNRTDGALVRLTVMVAPGEDLAEADRVLEGFAAAADPYLADYIPD